jgi:hypothetical protein
MNSRHIALCYPASHNDIGPDIRKKGQDFTFAALHESVDKRYPDRVNLQCLRIDLSTWPLAPVPASGIPNLHEA